MSNNNITATNDVAEGAINLGNFDVDYNKL